MYLKNKFFVFQNVLAKNDMTGASAEINKSSASKMEKHLISKNMWLFTTLLESQSRKL